MSEREGCWGCQYNGAPTADQVERAKTMIGVGLESHDVAHLLATAEARLAPTASDEQRAREIADTTMACEGDAEAIIAQALGAARQQGAEQERGACAQIADRCRKEREHQLKQIPITAVHRTAWVECKASEAKRIAAAIRARGGSE